MAFVGMRERYAESGRWDHLLEKYGLNPRAIVNAVRDVLKRKGAQS
jgi:transketolase C-terminal domain/subunit